MRRRLVTLATTTIVALAMAVPAGAVELQDSHQGTECPGGFALLHFVNNQTGGVVANLVVTFDNGDTVSLAPDKSTANTNHWTIAAPDSVELVTANTDGPGKLVLSDFECGEGKKGKK